MTSECVFILLTIELRTRGIVQISTWDDTARKNSCARRVSDHALGLELAGRIVQFASNEDKGGMNVVPGAERAELAKITSVQAKLELQRAPHLCGAKIVGNVVGHLGIIIEAVANGLRQVFRVDSSEIFVRIGEGGVCGMEANHVPLC